jgi:hypothetical protein
MDRGNTKFDLAVQEKNRVRRGIHQVAAHRLGLSRLALDTRAQGI